MPQVVVSGSSVYVAWKNLGGSGLSQLYFSESQNGGTTFSKAINLSHDSGNAETPVLNANGLLLVVMWDDSSSGSNLPIAVTSTNGGTTFSVQIKMNSGGTYDEQQNDQPEIAYNGNVFFAAWLDSDSTSGHNEIFFNSGTVP